MSIKPKTFRYELAPSGVATITLTRPDTLNSLTFEVYEELRDTFAALDHERRRPLRPDHRRGPRVLLGRRRRTRSSASSSRAT